MSASASTPVKKPVRSEGTAALPDLLRQMDTPPGESPFTPIAPRSCRTLLGAAAGHSEKDRILAWHWWRTTDVDPRGRTGPKKLHRTPYPHDERGELSSKHIARDLGVAPPNVTRSVNALLEEGILAKDEKGRTYPTGNAPDPRRLEREPGGGEDEAKTKKVVICTDNKIVEFSLYLQQHDFSGHDSAMASVKAVQDLKRKAAADTAAILREWENKQRRRIFEQYGFVPQESNAGRRKLKRKPIVQLTFLDLPPELSVQTSSESVQISPRNCVQNEKISVEKTFPGPILITSDTEKNLYEPTEGSSRSSSSPSGNPSPKLARALIPAENEKPKGQKVEGILRLAQKIGMNAPAAHYQEIRDLWNALTPDERRKAVEGIETRVAVGEYDELRFIPRLRRYLKEKLWEESLRPRKKQSGVDNSYLDDLEDGDTK